MFEKLENTILALREQPIAADRKELLQPLIDYIQNKVHAQQKVRLNLICTHNSRRSHLAQIWSQTAAAFFNIKNVSCYSGGTEVSALYPMVAQTLAKQGFIILPLSEGTNTVYAIKYSANETPIIAFSKKYDDLFNPESEFVAIMTCSQADGACPFIAGAEIRIPITFNDPKAFDASPQQAAKYLESSIQIAAEMFYVFSKISH
ncbi:MAG: protein-tyrosine-phosphatase [Flavobacterium sp.]|nr:protein-tyrosine-phosphatase [Flavobacterium sp.]